MCSMKKLSCMAFTIVELLVVISVIVLLGALSLPVLGRMMDGGRQASEIASARSLIAAFLNHAAENNNKLLPGFNSPEPGTVLKDSENGEEITIREAQQRYAWRIAPYLNYDIPGLLGSNAKYAPPSDPMYHYLVSVYTPLGMNTTFVGGHFGSGAMVPADSRRTPAGTVVQSLHQAAKPSQLIVFASAFNTQQGRKPGNFYVLPPRLRSGDGNNVDFRWNDKAVVACLDGHVELLDREQMMDMRRWANRAAETDNPNSNGLR